jgi:1-acyl-sn-glycerol-3-phosphate acyltransferase
VPVFIQGSGRAWPRGRTLPRPAKVRVTFGPPQIFERRAADGRKRDYEDVSRRMMAAIGRLAGGALEGKATSDVVTAKAVR